MHIGNLIEQKAKERKISANDIAAQMKKSRYWVYDIFKRKNISTNYLRSFSELLEVEIHELLGVPSPGMNLLREPIGNYERVEKDQLIGHIQKLEEENKNYLKKIVELQEIMLVRPQN